MASDFVNAVGNVIERRKDLQDKLDENLSDARRADAAQQTREADKHIKKVKQDNEDNCLDPQSMLRAFRTVLERNNTLIRAYHPVLSDPEIKACIEPRHRKPNIIALFEKHEARAIAALFKAQP